MKKLELYYNSSDKFCEVAMFEELKMDTDSHEVCIS